MADGSQDHRADAHGGKLVPDGTLAIFHGPRCLARYRPDGAPLIEAGADVNAKDSLGWTPLIRAAVGGNAEAVTLLLAAGADKNAEDFFGRTAMEVAEGRGHEEVKAALGAS